MPCVFWDHLFQYPDQMRDLIAMRREADLHARSSIVINCAESDMYVATIDDKCAFLYLRTCHLHHIGAGGVTVMATLYAAICGHRAITGTVRTPYKPKASCSEWTSNGNLTTHKWATVPVSEPV